MTFDLEGQGQGQNRERWVKLQKLRLGPLKMYLLLQFSTEGIHIPEYGSPLLGAYGLSTEF